MACSSKLKTLLLSSNHFACDAVTLNNANNLGTGPLHSLCPAGFMVLVKQVILSIQLVQHSKKLANACNSIVQHAQLPFSQATYHQLLCAHVVTRSVVDIANLVKKLLSSPGWNMLQPAVTGALDQVRDYGAFIKIEAVRCSRHLSLPLFQLAFCRHTTCPVTKMVQVDPFARSIPQTYLTMVLAFAGNDLTVQAAMVPPVDAGKLLSRDRIRRGAISLFSG